MNKHNLVVDYGDINDQQQMEAVLSNRQPDQVLHAATLLTPPNKVDFQDKPEKLKAANRKFIETNQAKVLAKCVAAYAKKKPSLYVLLVSTFFVFDATQAKNDVITETTPHKKDEKNLYTYSKDEAEKYWAEILGDCLAVVYPPQIYGPYQFTSALVHKILSKMLFNEKHELVLNADAEFNPIHVESFMSILVKLCAAAKTGQFCINGDKPIKLVELAKEAAIAV